MPRFYLRLIFILFLCLTAALLLIHARPYDDAELRLLLPEGCPAPCFMGIRPGVTTIDEAMRILQATGWIAHYDYQDGGASLNIQWNDNSPAWLPHTGLHGGTSIWIENGLISQLNLETNLMLGNIQLGMGQSPYQHISLNDFEGHYFLFYAAVYPNTGINISASRDCYDQQGRISYQDKVYLHYAPLPTGTDFPPTYHYSWLDVLHTPCR